MLIRHMTQEEYLERYSSLFKELSAILRKKEVLPYSRLPEQKKMFLCGSQSLYYTTYAEFLANQINSVHENHRENIHPTMVENGEEERSLNILEDLIKETQEEAYHQFVTKNGGKEEEKYPESNRRATEICNKIISKLSSSRFDLKDLKKSNKLEVRRAIDGNTYHEDMKNGLITLEKIESICASVGVKIPKQFYTEAPPQTVTPLQRLGIGLEGKDFYLLVKDSFEPHRNTVVQKWNQDDKEITDLLDSFRFDETLLPRETNEGMALRKVEAFSEVNSKAKEKMHMLIGYTINGFSYIEKLNEDLADMFCAKLAFRLVGKLAAINDKVGLPNLSINRCEFVDNGICTDFDLTYNHESINNNAHQLELKIKTETIVAGGYYQSMHYRYLVKPYHNGKMVNESSLIDLFEIN